MNGTVNEHAIIHLHKKVIAALGGSTQKKPVTMDELDNLASKVLGGAKILEKFLEQLVAAGAVTRSSGVKDGESYVAFWATARFLSFAKTVETTARPFTAADKGLIKKMHGFMPAQQLLDILNERLACDLGQDATSYTMEQLYAEIGEHAAVPVGGHDWPSLRKLLAKAERDGVLAAIDEQTIDDFAVVFSLNTKQVTVLKDIVLQAKEEQRDRLAASKAATVIREQAEARLPKHLLYTKGWPTTIPTYEEAVLIGDVRKTVGAALGLDVRYTDPDDIRAHYAVLLKRSEDRELSKEPS